EAYEKASEEIIVGVENEKYGYKPQSYSTDIKNYGCVLATAAYIAYSITGKVTSLAQANRIAIENDLYEFGADRQGVTEKNLIVQGDKYAQIVNLIAGDDYLEKDGEDFSVKADSDKNGKSGRQEIFDRIVQNSKSQSDVYFTHFRGYNDHSTLFDSISYSDEKNYKSSKFTVMDPWQGGTYKHESWSDIKRADFYKLTQNGLEIYNLTRKAMRSGV
ncbi:MAG: hypothetical protein K6A42_02780, partial [Treponema sp.]|nr:hypothetical protein [Treponema sp.]